MKKDNIDIKYRVLCVEGRAYRLYSEGRSDIDFQTIGGYPDFESLRGGLEKELDARNNVLVVISNGSTVDRDKNKIPEGYFACLKLLADLHNKKVWKKLNKLNEVYEIGRRDALKGLPNRNCFQDHTETLTYYRGYREGKQELSQQNHNLEKTN